MDNIVTDNAPESTPMPVETPAQTNERLFKQSELNEIVGRAKHEAVESFKRHHLQNQAPQTNVQPNGRAFSEDDIRKLTSEELARQRDEWAREAQEKAHTEAAHRIVNTYKEKIAAGKGKYEDFDAVTNTVDMRYYPNVVQLLAEHVDNSADVLYELSKNRTKLHQIESVCAHNSPDAIYEIKRLSDSIKANEQNSQMKNAKTPLSQNRPSITGTDSGAVLSIADLKRKYRA